MLQIIVGGTMEGVNAVEAGYIDVLLNCPTYEVGYQAVVDTVKILNGEIIADGKTFVEMDGFLLTQENFAEMWSQTFGAIAAR
jgi:ABC-type sugar transport system substrate-binding protein